MSHKKAETKAGTPEENPDAATKLPARDVPAADAWNPPDPRQCPPEASDACKAGMALDVIETLKERVSKGHADDAEKALYAKCVKRLDGFLS